MNRIELNQNIETFLSLLKEFDVCEDPFLSYSFLSVYLRKYSNHNFRFYYVYNNDNLIGIIPFECTYSSSILNVEKLRFIGYRDFNYEQYICRDEDMEQVHNAFMNYLKCNKRSIIINFYDINNLSPLYALLRKTEYKNKTFKLYSCPYLHFMDNFAEFFKVSYKAPKKRLERFQQKVSELGDFKIINVENKESYDENTDYLNQIYRVHSERFANVYATSFFGSENMKPYYSELIKSLMYGEKGYITMLVLDKVVIAFIFCITNGKVLISWIPAFDPAFQKYSLGMIHYKMYFETICNQAKYKVFDFSKGSSQYKRKWAKEETANYQFIVSLNNSIVSSLLCTIDCWFFGLKVYLRNHNMLSKIKFFIGGLRKPKKADIPNFSIEYTESNEEIKHTFKYSNIRQYPVECRTAILNALFDGDKLVSIKKEKDRIVIVMTK